MEARPLPVGAAGQPPHPEGASIRAAVRRHAVQERRAGGRFSGKGACRSRCGGAPLPPRPWRDSATASASPLHGRTGSRAFGGGAADRGVSSDQDRGLFGATGRPLQALLAPVVQNEFNSGGQAFQARLAGLPLSVGFRHLRAEGDKPLAISLNHGRVAVSHVRNLTARGRADNSKSCRPHLPLWCWTLYFCFPARGQNYAINWSTIDGGGGTSYGILLRPLNRPHASRIRIQTRAGTRAWRKLP
jgi:hypothetical protein